MPKDDSVAVVLSDFHCGHTLGLLNPETKIERTGQDDKTFQLGAVQEYLWNLYLTCLNRLEVLAGKAPVTIFLNGDITHGTKYLEAVFAVSAAEQVQIARWCIDEILRRKKLRVKHVRFLLGTAAHTLDGTTEQLLSDLLSALYPNIDIGLSGIGLYNIGVGGADFDVAHHGPSVGSREWGTGNTARLYCLSLMMRCIRRKQEPPRVVIRSHRHRKVWETVRYAEYATEMIVTPSFCGMNGHGLQVTQSLDEQDHGVYAFVVSGGDVKVVPMVETVDLRRREVLA